MSSAHPPSEKTLTLYPSTSASSSSSAAAAAASQPPRNTPHPPGKRRSLSPCISPTPDPKHHRSLPLIQKLIISDPLHLVSIENASLPWPFPSPNLFAPQPRENPNPRSLHLGLILLHRSRGRLTASGKPPLSSPGSAVLDEDTFVTAIEKIIERDFLPDIPSLFKILLRWGKQRREEFVPRRKPRKRREFKEKRDEVRTRQGI